MANIERREVRLRNIRERLNINGRGYNLKEQVSTNPEEQYHIGVSQNMYEDIGTFLRGGKGDPALEVL